MNSVSRRGLESVGGGLLDAGIMFGRGAGYVFVDIGPVVNLPIVGSLRFGRNKRIMRRVW